MRRFKTSERYLDPNIRAQAHRVCPPYASIRYVLTIFLGNFSNLSPLLDLRYHLRSRSRDTFELD